MTPEERRKAIISAVVDTITVSPFEGYYNLLAYFDEHEPAVADAIRYGLKEVPCGCDCGELFYKPASRP